MGHEEEQSNFGKNGPQAFLSAKFNGPSPVDPKRWVAGLGPIFVEQPFAADALWGHDANKPCNKFCVSGLVGHYFLMPPVSR